MALDKLTIINNGGLSTTSDYRVGVLTATKFIGPIESGSATFTGSVSIGGTLTYEDVTNIDSVGIITARDGIDCNADLDVDGHTNLDNVSISGITTTGDITIEDASPRLQFLDTNADADEKKWDFKCNPDSKFVIQAINDSGSGGGSLFRFTRTGNNVDTFEAQKSGTIWLTISNENRKLTTRDLDVTNNLDVDGHTNLDNVSIAGVTTFATGDLNIGAVGRFDASGLVKSANGSESAPSHTFLNDPDNGMYRPTTNTLGFVTGGGERLRITSNGVVNIGTNNLDQTSYKAQIETGTNRFLSIKTANHDDFSDEGSGIFFSRQSDGSKELSGIFAHTNTSLGMASRAHLTFHAGGSGGYSQSPERLRITNQGLVGINTTDPSTQLQIVGSTASVDSSGGTLGIRQKGDTKTDGITLTSSHSNSARFWKDSDGALHIYNTGGHEDDFVLTNGGNLGIHDSTPSFTLDVNGTGRFTGDLAVNSGQKIFTNSSQGQLTIQGGATYPGSAIKFAGGQSGTTDRGTMIFYASTSTSLEERVRIRYDGKVGIGTNNPSQELTLYGTDPIFSVQEATASSQVDIGTGTVTGFINIQKANGTRTIQVSGDGVSYFNAGTNFGIGTNNPQSILHIEHATPGIRLSDTGNSGAYAFFDANAANAIIHADKGNTVSDSRVAFAVDNAEKARITSNGLRVNTTVDNGSGYSAHFHDTGTSNRIQLTTGNTGTSSSDGAIIMIDSGSNMEILNRENTNLEFFTNNTERVRIYNDGRVDIGGTNEVQITGSSQAILYLHGAIVGADVDFAYGQRIMLDDDDTGSTSADRERGSIYCQFNGNCTGGDTSNETRIWNIYSDVNCNEDYDNVYGLYSDVRTTHSTGIISNMRGVYGICQATNSGQITEMIGVYGLSQPTSGSSGTVSDVVGVKGRVNMSAGTSTATATDLVGVWAEIDNDNNASQGSGGKCALFYGGYNKTTGLHNPQGIRIDTNVPNYMRGGLALGNGGNFLPADNHLLHIQDQENARGILLKQTGDNYNTIEGDANRSGAGNAILDLRGKWSGTEVARIRFEAGTDTSNKDDGQIQFYTASAGSISERMHIQPNGEIAVKSNGVPTDALANFHVQNGTFRVSQASGSNTEYLQVTTHTHNTNGNRHAMRSVSNGTNYMTFSKNGIFSTLSHHNAGRTRSDANSPANYYAHGSFGFFAFSGRTDDTSNYRNYLHMRVWDGGDDGDRNVIYYANSGSDTTTVDYDQHQKFGIKSDGYAQFGNSVLAGRVESDEASPNSVYLGASGTGFFAYPNTSNQQTQMRARTTDNTDTVLYADTGGGAVFKVVSNGNGYFDGEADVGNADYAEFFEWVDGNSEDVDRRGITVVMDGEKIRPATSSDDTSKIIGVVSANPGVVGDSAWSEWQGRHKRDAYGSWVTEEQEFLVWNKFGTDVVDGVKVPRPQPNINDPYCNPEYSILVSDIEKEKARGTCPQKAIDQNLRMKKQNRVVSEEWDSSKIYTPRSDRKEWTPIGLVGKLVVRRGQPIGANWILMKSNVGIDPTDNTIVLDKYLVR